MYSKSITYLFTITILCLLSLNSQASPNNSARHNTTSQKYGNLILEQLSDHQQLISSQASTTWTTKHITVSQWKPTPSTLQVNATRYIQYIQEYSIPHASPKVDIFKSNLNVPIYPVKQLASINSDKNNKVKQSNSGKGEKLKTITAENPFKHDLKVLTAKNDDIYFSEINGLAAGSYQQPNKWSIAFNPYANFINNYNYNYHGANFGLLGDFTYRATDAFSIGAHIDMNSAHYYTDTLHADTRSTSFSAGLHTAFNIKPHWYIEAQFTGSTSQISGEYNTKDIPFPLGNSTYNSEAIYASITSGYKIKLNEVHSLTPEIGFNYLSAHIGNFNNIWNTPPDTLGSFYNMYNENHYYNALYANLHLEWRGEWDLQDDRQVALIVGGGVRQKLNAKKINLPAGTLGGAYITESTEDPTTWLANLGVEYKVGNFSVNILYNGGYGEDQVMHGGDLVFKFEF